MCLHVDDLQGFFQEDYEHARRDLLIDERVLLHIGLLREAERRVLEPCRMSLEKLALPDSWRYW